MNNINGYDSSDEETPIAKKPVKILVPTVTDIEYKRTIKPTERKSLLEVLGKPTEKTKALGVGTAGGPLIQLNPTRLKPVESSRPEFESPKKQKRQSTKQSPSKQINIDVNEDTKDADDFDFFTLPSSPKNIKLEPVQGPIQGPAKPQFISTTQPLKRKRRVENETELFDLRDYDNTARTPIQVLTITHDDQLDSTYKTHKLHSTTSKDTQLYDNVFKNVELDGNGGFVRNNNIMSLVRDAKMRYAAHEEQKSERKLAQRATRSKYGF